MFSKTKTLALSALIAFSAIAAAPSAANAGDIKIDVHFGTGFGPGFGYGPGYGYGYKHCTPSKALYKAKSMGLKKAYVSKANWNGVIVKGKKFGQKKVVAFGKSASCPVKYWQ
ncbi:hypothetical protein [Mesorhizobium sp. J428]|uniref:hypothetical protein n=1 Tax=Mesorhizobium sp. J428 TaxID=2898440 RepID=UPI002150AF6D|nr:hypothetical protein [Mesorhizobium sp. J428]MCR5855472.1 hypothetical protein [Mesorhizobium sp. J428]